MIVKALETGFVEGEGPSFPQKRTEIKPRLPQRAKNRLYQVAMRRATFPTSPGPPHRGSTSLPRTASDWRLAVTPSSATSDSIVS